MGLDENTQVYLGGLYERIQLDADHHKNLLFFHNTMVIMFHSITFISSLLS